MLNENKMVHIIFYVLSEITKRNHMIVSLKNPSCTSMYWEIQKKKLFFWNYLRQFINHETNVQYFLNFFFRLKRFQTRTNPSSGSSSSRSGPAWTCPKLSYRPSFWSQDLSWKSYLIITTTRIYLQSKNQAKTFVVQ